ncbi:MAG: hypothetical protein P4K93_07430 [Terracidiphilus sp.]|nr:hypothetical protein [Terracidiphilus sp.]
MAGKKKADDGVPTTYTVLHPINHDNELYKRDEPIDLTSSHAERLLALKVIGPYVAPAPTPGETN